MLGSCVFSNLEVALIRAYQLMDIGALSPQWLRRRAAAGRDPGPVRTSSRTRAAVHGSSLHRAASAKVRARAVGWLGTRPLERPTATWSPERPHILVIDEDRYLPLDQPTRTGSCTSSTGLLPRLHNHHFHKAAGSWGQDVRGPGRLPVIDGRLQEKASTPEPSRPGVEGEKGFDDLIVGRSLHILRGFDLGTPLAISACASATGLNALSSLHCRHRRRAGSFPPRTR